MDIFSWTQMWTWALTKLRLPTVAWANHQHHKNILGIIRRTDGCYIICCLTAPPGEASLRLLATYLKQHSKPLAAQLPGLVAAAAVKLHAAAEQLLQGCFSQSDGQSDTVLLVLDGLHEALQQCGCDDGVLRGCVAIRLALLLEQRGELHHARLVIQQVSNLDGHIMSLFCAPKSQQHTLANFVTMIEQSLAS